MLLTRIWKNIPGFNNYYQASIYGKIRRIISGPSTKCGRILKQTRHHSGYLDVCLCVGGKQYKSLSVHKLILITFVGPRPDGYQCRHLDGDKRNNKLSNLKWGTPQENAKDRYRHGRYNGVRGSMNIKSKLTEDQVIEIKLMIGSTCKYKHNNKTTLKQIAQQYGVSTATISAIKNGKIWTHMEIKHV